jgi:hypothetical protein
MKSLTCAVLVVAGALSGCTATGAYFEEAKASDEHAVLRFQTQKGFLGSALGSTEVVPMSINDLPPSHKKWTLQKFLVSSGPIDLEVKILGKGRIMAICTLSFIVEPRRVYTINAEHDPDQMRAIVVREDAAEVARCGGSKQLEPIVGPPYWTTAAQ